MLVHALLGFYQIYPFSNDEYPSICIFKHQFFNNIQTWFDVYVTFVKRPCGLFPEPSALAAAVDPWLVLLAGILADPDVRVRYCPYKYSRWLFGTAFLAGFILLALSRSGLAPLILVAVIAIGISKSRAQIRTLGPGAIVAGPGIVAVACAGNLHFMTGAGENIEA